MGGARISQLIGGKGCSPNSLVYRETSGYKMKLYSNKASLSHLDHGFLLVSRKMLNPSNPPRSFER